MVLFSPTLLAEKSGDVAKVVEDVELKEEPDEDAPGYGWLRKGTIVTFGGEQRNGFLSVIVEQEDEDLRGWIIASSMDEETRTGGYETNRPEKKEKEKGPRKFIESKRRIRVPKDEGILMRGDRNFFYGLHGGGNYNIIQVVDDPNMYLGWGFSAGANIGFYFSRNVPFRFEVAYTLVQGIEQNGDGTLLQFGFLDVGAMMQYVITSFELFGGLQYSFGMSIGGDHQGVPVLNPDNLPSPFDLSSIYGVGGIGYRMKVGEMTNLILRVRYAISFLLTPIAVQQIGLYLYLEIGG